MIQESPPLQYRWQAWKIKLYDETIYQPELYDRLLKIDSRVESDIKKDISRTFSELQFYQNDRNPQGQESLFRVLKAISNYYPKMGYTQGINFVVGFTLLINGGNEIESFWLFIFLSRNINFLLLAFYEDNFPFVQILIHIFHRKFKEKIPELYNHFYNEINLPDPMVFYGWFLTLFIYSYPFDFVARLWDYLISTDIFSLVSLSLAILQKYEKLLLEKDLQQLQEFFKSLKSSDEWTQNQNAEQFLQIDELFKLSSNSFKIDSEFIYESVENYIYESKVQNMYTDYFLNFKKDKKEAQLALEKKMSFNIISLSNLVVNLEHQTIEQDGGVQQQQ